MWRFQNWLYFPCRLSMLPKERSRKNAVRRSSEIHWNRVNWQQSSENYCSKPSETQHSDLAKSTQSTLRRTARWDQTLRCRRGLRYKLSFGVPVIVQHNPVKAICEQLLLLWATTTEEFKRLAVKYTRNYKKGGGRRIGFTNKRKFKMTLRQ